MTSTGYADVRAVAKPAGYPRMYLDGVDITYLRDVATPPPDYSLIEPGGYGPATLVLPQVNGNLEELGTGDLHMVREDALLVLQQVDDPTLGAAATVLDDRVYRGYVMSINTDGDQVTLQLGGEFAGPASMIDVHDPLVRRVKDVGFWFANTVQQLGLSPTTRSGPVTGIEIVDGGGGGSLWQRALDVCAWSQDETGAQRTIMPTDDGRWSFDLKDTTTRHVTLFTDHNRVSAQLRRDRSQRPNTWFGTGYTPDGVYWKNARYPGYFTAPPPPFPGTMALGDTDADTTTGDGVTVLTEKLVQMGLLSLGSTGVYGVYTAATVRAVKVLQGKGGRSRTGTVNLGTWNDLFDNDVTGVSLTGAYIEPLLQDDAVRVFNRTANGSIAGRNPDRDPSVKRCDRTIEFGPDVTKAQATRWCVGQANRLAGKNISGTIVLSAGFGGFAGDWDTSDKDFLNGPDGVDHIMSQLEIKAGMNAWLPMYDGGTLVHIAGVDVNRADRTVTLTVDTLARDLLEVAAIIKRKKEAGRHIRREWFSENRPRKHSGAMVARDELFGLVDRDIRLRANRWNLYPVIMGQQGLVNRVRLRTVNRKALYSVAAFGVHMTEAKLRRKVPNPFTVAGGESAWEKESLQDWYDKNILLYAYGDENQLCGTFPRRYKGDNGQLTHAPVTGRHDDAAPWPYIGTPGQPMIVWIAVYPDRDCTLKKGQQFWPQLDDVG